jgi:hypothetical protein
VSKLLIVTCLSMAASAACAAEKTPTRMAEGASAMDCLIRDKSGDKPKEQTLRIVEQQDIIIGDKKFLLHASRYLGRVQIFLRTVENAEPLYSAMTSEDGFTRLEFMSRNPQVSVKCQPVN